jgi:dihydropteroate synthase
MIANLDLNTPQIMGILNVTPDSFSDGGALYRNGRLDVAIALDKARVMIAQGASIIDVGGESTRPQAQFVAVEEELSRVIPVVEAIAQDLDVAISVDTSTPEVMSAAASAGAHLLNDVRALQQPGALLAAVSSGLPVCIMHMRGEPKTMQNNPQYSNVVTEVVDFFQTRLAVLQAAGIDRDKILLDPGFGFGKTAEHNLQLLNQLPEFKQWGCPVLVGISRKSLFQHVLGRPVADRLAGSLAGALLAVQKGASVIRVHDVAATRDVLKFLNSVETAND